MREGSEDNDWQFLQVRIPPEAWRGRKHIQVGMLFTTENKMFPLKKKGGGDSTLLHQHLKNAICSLVDSR